MTRDVLVSITGARFSEHDKEDVEMIIGGDYFWKNGKHYVLYEEVMEESGEVVKKHGEDHPGFHGYPEKGQYQYPYGVSERPKECVLLSDTRRRTDGGN